MGGDTHIIDTKTNEEYYAPCETELLDLLNSLHEENEQLKKEKAISNQRLRECAMRLDKYLGNCR